MRTTDQPDPPPQLGELRKREPAPAPTPVDRRVTSDGKVREDKDGRFYTTPTGTP
jgi:hypothetical protein